MTFLNDLSLTQLLTRLAAYLVLVAIHGLVLALLADRLGDREPAFIGRLTANPFVQLSVPGLISALFFHMGWLKPFVLDPTKLRFGRGGLVLVALSSLVLLLVLVVLCNPLRILISATLTGTASLTALGVVQEIQQQGIWYVLVNVLPIPGLTGALWLQALVPAATGSIRRYALPCMLGLIVLGAFDLPEKILGVPYALLSSWLITLIS
ncbi:MAG TPA: hypothetical protein VGM83_17715 [Devosiaceae bacterium]|jgi:hypothetical protein